jgi:hypothetical protein
VVKVGSLVTEGKARQAWQETRSFPAINLLYTLLHISISSDSAAETHNVQWERLREDTLLKRH